MKYLLIPLLLLSLLLATPACAPLAKNGPYADKTLYLADQTIGTSYDTLHAFVKWEKSNRSTLQAQPQIRASADVVRANAERWVQSAVMLREAYANDPNADNKSKLETGIGILHAAIQEATSYLSQPLTPVK